MCEEEEEEERALSRPAPLAVINSLRADKPTLNKSLTTPTNWASINELSIPKGCSTKTSN